MSQVSLGLLLMRRLATIGIEPSLMICLWVAISYFLWITALSLELAYSQCCLLEKPHWWQYGPVEGRVTDWC